MKLLSPALDSMSVGWLPDNGIIERIKNVIINKGLTEEEFAHAINVPESALKEVFLRGNTIRHYRAGIYYQNL